MSSRHLLWIGSTGEDADTLRGALQTQLDDLTVAAMEGAPEALDALGQDPGHYLLVVVELGAVTMELGALVTRMKQINPAIEIIVLGKPDLSWTTLDLPRYYRPIFLVPPLNPDVLISCVAKLKEMVEAKEDHAYLMRGTRRQVSLSHMNVEALLELLHRNSKLGTIVIRRDGFFLSINAEARRLTGYAGDEITHIQNWAHTLIADPEAVSSLVGIVNGLWEEKSGKAHLDVLIKRKDGKRVTLHLTLTVLLNEVAQPQRMLMLLHDPLEDYGLSEYQALIENGQCGLYTYHPSKGFLRISSAALDLINRAFSLDLKVEHVLDRRIKDLPLPEEMAVLWQGSLERVAQSRSTDAEELLPLGLPGRRIMDHALVTRVIPGNDEPGAVIAHVVAREDLRSGTFQNVSIQELAEKTLDNIPRPFLLLKAVRDEDGTVQDFLCLKANAAAKSLLELDLTLPCLVPIGKLFSNQEAARLLAEQARKVTDTGREANFEVRLKQSARNGTPILVNVFMGKVGNGTAVFFEDVTAAREEERQLKQYRHCFAHMQEAIIVTDLKGRIIDWNPASERMLGYEKPKNGGQPSVILARNGKKKRLEQLARNVLQEGDVWKDEYEFIREDGSRGVAFATIGLLKDDRGEPYGTVGLWHDLTNRKRLEERLTVQTSELREKNLALNTLLRHAEEERIRACEQVAAEVTRGLTDRVFQILESKQMPDLVESHALLLLKDLETKNEPERLDMPAPLANLSEKELEVARLIRLGKTTEEIAFVLEKSLDTVRLQRISIRKKLGLRRRNQSLAGFLKKIAPI